MCETISAPIPRRFIVLVSLPAFGSTKAWLAVHIDPLQHGEQNAEVRHSIDGRKVGCVPLCCLQQRALSECSEGRVRTDGGIEIGRRHREDLGGRGKELEQPIKLSTPVRFQASGAE
ncbi:hypothetical protein C3941_10595 [Kaistia algarum]|uniref:hypothetical protein n=1 Tax=Kaistia algarum TaxID=2083279 RepID=UPI000CE7E0B5|nr:hypothetical protein [Kaistia algarum]MCX5514798.1 hypothetical protein [Kaistia algarum]PPE79562.1 hypothetical protein C3941_10595 [Kaistia algarum]